MMFPKKKALFAGSGTDFSALKGNGDGSQGVPFATIAGLGSMALDSISQSKYSGQFDTEGAGLAVGKGALAGAAAGTAILPGWGTAIGAVVGGASSYFKNATERKKNNSAKQQWLGQQQDQVTKLANQQNNLFNQNITRFSSFAKEGGTIHIKPKNKGKFTDYCGGDVTSSCIRKGKNSNSATIRKRATFAANARKWHHQKGGTINLFCNGGILRNGKKVCGCGCKINKMGGGGTTLSPGQEIAYQTWRNNNQLSESDDYDLKGFWKQEGFNIPVLPPGHFTDKYKKLAPFSPGDGYQQISDESKYSRNPSYLTGRNDSFDKRGQGTWINDKFVAYGKGGSVGKKGVVEPGESTRTVKKQPLKVATVDLSNELNSLIPRTESPNRNSGSIREYTTAARVRDNLRQNVVPVAKIAANMAQIGNFVPHPIGQAIGKAGSIASAAFDGGDAVESTINGNYGDAAISATSMLLPAMIRKRLGNNKYYSGNGANGPGVIDLSTRVPGKFVDASKNKVLAAALIGQIGYDSREMSKMNGPRYGKGGSVGKKGVVEPTESTGVAKPIPKSKLVRDVRDVTPDSKSAAFLSVFFNNGDLKVNSNTTPYISQYIKNGRPNINLVPGMERANYIPETNTLNIAGESDYQAELAHAQQFQKDYKGSLNRKLADDIFYEDSDDPIKGKYGVEGTIENEAHSVIEPRLINEIKLHQELVKQDTKLLQKGLKKKLEKGGEVFNKGTIEGRKAAIDAMYKGETVRQNLAGDLYSGEYQDEFHEQPIQPTFTPERVAEIPSVKAKSMVVKKVLPVVGKENVQTNLNPTNNQIRLVEEKKKIVSKPSVKPGENVVDSPTIGETVGGIANGIERWMDKKVEKVNATINPEASDVVYEKPKAVTAPAGSFAGYVAKGRAIDRKSGNVLHSFTNEFDNAKGGTYNVLPKMREMAKDSTLNNVEGVAHFIMDGDITENQKFTSSYISAKREKINSVVPGKFINSGVSGPEQYVTQYKLNPDKTYSIRYRKVKDIQEYNPGKGDYVDKEGFTGDLAVRSHRFSDIDWAGKGKSTGYATKSEYVPLKNGQFTSIVNGAPGQYSRFSGGSGIYVFKDKTGRQIGIDVGGSINDLRKAGEEIIKKYGVKPEALDFLYHDMGSYSAKPKANAAGRLTTAQWRDFNTYNRGYSGAAIVIPKKKFESGGAVILGGERHHDGGNDVVNEEGEKVAETETKELLLTKEQTVSIENFRQHWYKSYDESLLMELGKYFTNIINNDTIDNSGIYL